MPVVIKNRWTDEPIATVEDTDDLREAVIRLVKKGISLRGANLYGANLDGANLYGANLERANLKMVNLDEANLERANLGGANLKMANLDGANLDEANLDDSTRLETGETWKEYRDEVLPQLMTLGGKTLMQVAAAWDCHEWANCPMHVAYDFTGDWSEATPLLKLLRPRIDQFVRLFDAKLIPRPAAVETPIASA